MDIEQLRFPIGKFDQPTTITPKGIYIQSVICDGRRGLLTSFGDIPIQMCQFHQQQIIVRYLTQKPRLQASIELKELASKLIHSSKLDFERALGLWHKCTVK